jgi:ADP-ribose pyrophosphatase
VFAGHLIRVDVEEWEGVGRREIVHHPGACAGVVLVGTDRVVLIRQRREAVRQELLEIPAGLYDIDGELPGETMAREVAEETGCRVIEQRRLGAVLTTPGFSDERIDLFLVRAERGGQPEERIESVELPFAEAIRMVHRGEIEDAKSAVALLLAEPLLRKEGGGDGG